MAIEALWIYPPLAFGRLGGSSTPLECFLWGEDDNAPHGSGRTTILPAPTFKVAEDGTLSSYVPAQMAFKDEQGFRPVCPFFELHARWSDESGGSSEGPVTPELLALHGLRLQDITWKVHVANLKPFNMAQDGDLQIDAHVQMLGSEFGVFELQGRGPENAVNPLVPSDRYIPLGCVQLIRPSEEYPEIRLRFTPARGVFYGPTNLKQRWTNVTIDEHCLFLNKDSKWCSWKPADDDARGTPGGQYAQDENGVSYGMIDDVCDGLVTCMVGPGPWTEASAGLLAHARIAVGPPDYAPDRRHFTSLADGLKDRVDRADVYEDDYYVDGELCDLEITELLRRIYETAGLNNVDVFNQRVNVQENPEIALQLGIPFQPLQYSAFPYADALDRRPLPLSDSARENHRRFPVLAAFLDRVRRQPDLLQQIVRQPLDREPFFDRRMPALMRGPSGAPLSLTRRQYEFLMRWAARRSTLSEQA